MNQIHESVLRSIDTLSESFSNNPYIFLTEGDMQSYLIKDLLQNSNLNQIKTSRDNKKTYVVHSEISFFGENEKLNNRVDIAVIDVSTLDLYSTTRPSQRLSKGFEFSNANVGIEVKMNRRGNKLKVIMEIEKDSKKLEKLKRRNPSTLFIVVYFDKKNQLTSHDINELQTKYGSITIRYSVPNKVNRND